MAILRNIPIAVLLLTTAAACTYDAGIEPADKYNIYLGSFELLDQSSVQFPYHDKTGVVFKDSVGNEVVFTIQVTPPGSSQITHIRYDVYNPGDTVRYTFEYEFRHAHMYCEDLDVRFSVGLRSEPYEQNLAGGYVADVLDVWLYHQGLLTKASRVFWHVLHQRTWPEVFSVTHNIALLTVFDRDFLNVLETSITNPKSKVYFSYALGIVSFTDHTGKRWRFDHFL